MKQPPSVHATHSWQFSMKVQSLIIPVREKDILSSGTQTDAVWLAASSQKKNGFLLEVIFLKGFTMLRKTTIFSKDIMTSSSLLGWKEIAVAGP